MNKSISSDHQHRLGEGIIWDHRKKLLLFVDILSKKLFMMDIDSFDIVDEFFFNEYIGWVQLTNDPDSYLIGLQSGLAIFNIRKSKIKYINKDIPSYPKQRLNDSYVDGNGRLWYGSMEYESIELYNGVLANILSTKGKVKIVDEDYGITNGPIINNENNYLYHNDSKKGIVYKCQLNMEKDNLKDKIIFLQFNPLYETPDGMCFDNKNNLFIAIWGGASVNEYNESGELICCYELPEKFITNVCFGGEKLDRMFVTTAKSDGFQISHDSGGHIYEILDHNCQGLRANEFLL